MIVPVVGRGRVSFVVVVVVAAAVITRRCVVVVFVLVAVAGVVGLVGEG